MTPPITTPPPQGAFSNLRVALVASVSASIVTLIFVSAVAPFSLGAPAAGLAGGAPAALRHNAKEGEATADDSEIPAISKLLGRKFRIGSGPKCDPEKRKYNHNFVRELPHRNDIGALLQKMNLTGDGVELGVQRAHYSKVIMTAWTAGGKYYLVDPWKHQDDYVDLANGAQSEQDASYAEAMQRVKPFGDRPVVKRMFSFDAVKDFEDCSLDFVYIDAVHDYDGALADMIDWWPKLAHGGVFAGHDYGDFTMGGDGTGVPPTIFGVKSAADHFAVLVNRQLWATTNDPDVYLGHHFYSFYMIK